MLGFGPILAGLSLLPLTVTLLLAAPGAGRLYDRHGPRGLLVGGTLLMGASPAWLGIVLHQHSYPWLVPGYVGIGLALGLAISPASTDALNAAARQERGEASGLTQMARQLGGSLGLAVLGAIIASTHAGPGAAAARSATTTGTADGCLVAAGLMVVIAIVTAVVVRREAASDARPVAPAAPAAAAVEPNPEMSVAISGGQLDQLRLPRRGSALRGDGSQLGEHAARGWNGSPESVLGGAAGDAIGGGEVQG